MLAEAAAAARAAAAETADAAALAGPRQGDRAETKSDGMRNVIEWR